MSAPLTDEELAEMELVPQYSHVPLLVAEVRRLRAENAVMREDSAELLANADAEQRFATRALRAEARLRVAEKVVEVARPMSYDVEIICSDDLADAIKVWDALKGGGR